MFIYMYIISMFTYMYMYIYVHIYIYIYYKHIYHLLQHVDEIEERGVVEILGAI